MSLTVFMYHRILPDDRPESVSVPMFRRQLEYLRKHYRILQADEVEPYIDGKIQETRPCAALTFDDAWADNLFYATPVLKEFGLSAIVAVSAGCLYDGPVRTEEKNEILHRSMDQAQELSRQGDNRTYLSRQELLAMQESGVWRLEVHGTHHELGSKKISVHAVPQNGMDETQYRQFLKQDLLNAKAEISKLTGRDHKILFWPWGHYSAMSLKIATECGFEKSFTVAKGFIRSGDTRKVLPRVGVPPKWKKFVKNCTVFRSSCLTWLHSFSHSLKVCFDDCAEYEKGVEILSSYLTDRKEIISDCKRVLTEKNLPLSSLEDVFWETTVCRNGTPIDIMDAPLPNKKFNAVNFSGKACYKIFKSKEYCSLFVTPSRVLPLRDFKNTEDWFESLTNKTRKKMRWIRNAMPKAGAKIIPIEDIETFEQFEKMYSEQFPKHKLHSPRNQGVLEIYKELHRQGRALCRLLVAKDGTPLAACLAWMNQSGCFYTHLTRSRGEYDKFSPGFYLTYSVINELFESHKNISFFFMGPGEYDYKSALGGDMYPVCRFERRNIFNLFGIIRLCHKMRKLVSQKQS